MWEGSFLHMYSLALKKIIGTSVHHYLLAAKMKVACGPA